MNRHAYPLLGSLTLASALAGAGVAAQEPPRATARPPAVEALDERIGLVQADGLPLGAYHLAKAQAWADAAADAYHLGERGEGMTVPLAEADRLLRRLAAQDAGIPTGTPQIAGESRVREDLWQRAERVKAHPGFRCAQAETARFEVMLAMSGHFAARSGWREARPYVQAAERLGDRAQHRIDGCEAAPAASTGERDPADR